MMPRFKVTVTHDGSDTEYTPDNYTFRIKVKKRENNYDTAEITITDINYALYNSGEITRFDEVTVSFKDESEASYTDVFGGVIRQVNPILDEIGEGLILNCKGHGAALEDTHCNRDYGVESSTNGSYPDVWNVLKNVVADFVNKSFADTATGYSIDNTYIADYISTDIKYINNPYRTNMEVVDTICQLSSAIGAGTTAGGHYIVDTAKRFLFGKIGDHTAGTTSPEDYWPDWWDTDAAGSTLTQGADFETFTILDKAEEYANHIVLLTDFRRPCYDYWTNAAGISDGVWSTNNSTVSAVSSTPTQVVGDKCLKIAPSTPPGGPGYAYLRFNDTYALDVTKIGSIKTIPRLNFYSYKPAGLDETNTSVRLYKTAYDTNYFECVFSTVSQDDDVWAHKSIPIGPYWKSENTKEKDEFIWTSSGGDWTSIAGIAFKVAALTYLGVDDLHITGKVIRSAKHSQAIAAYNEYQKVLIARNAMDDSCIAEDDTGFAARIAYAELLRRIYSPKTIVFTTHTDMKTAMAGQKIHVHACKQSGGTFTIDSDMRILEIEFNLSEDTYNATVTATSDVKNSFAINNPDSYAMWQENMFVNSAEAKNIRAGSEVDLLIGRLEYDYGP